MPEARYDDSEATLSHTFRALADEHYRVVLETIARDPGPISAHSVARKLAKRRINVANVLRQLRRNQAIVMTGTRHHAQYRLVAGNLIAAGRWLDRLRSLLDGEESTPPVGGRTELREMAFESLLDEVEDAIAILHRNGEFEYANASFARLVGATVGELYFSRFPDFLRPEDRSDFAMLGAQTTEDQPLALVRQDGSITVVRHWVRPIESPTRELVGWTLVARSVRLSLR